MLRFIINAFFPSTFIFPDGSRIDYLIRDDCLRYTAAAPKRDVVKFLLSMTRSVSEVAWTKALLGDGGLMMLY